MLAIIFTISAIIFCSREWQ
ncbi:hypothetical protein [Helicobacter salomonis]